MRSGEPDAKGNPETCFESRKNEATQESKNETVGNSTRARSETEMKPDRKNLKTTQKL